MAVLAVAMLLAVAYGTRRLLVRNRLWARIWLTPTPGPDRTAGLDLAWECWGDAQE